MEKNRFALVFNKLEEAIVEASDQGDLRAETEEIEALRKIVLEVNTPQAIYFTSTK